MPSARAELRYTIADRSLRTVGGNLLVQNVTLDEAALMFLDCVIRVRMA